MYGVRLIGSKVLGTGVGFYHDQIMTKHSWSTIDSYQALTPLLPHKRADEVVLQKSIPAQICQLILCISKSEGQVYECVRELAFAKRLYKL